MNLKKHTLTGLFASAVSASQTSVGFSSGFEQGPYVDMECKAIVQDLVRLDSMLFDCQNKPVLTSAEILQCKELVACLIAEGFVIDQNLTESDPGITPGATTTQTVQVPTRCSDE